MQDRSVTSRYYQRIADLRVSTTDPDATIMLHKDGSHLGYQAHYAVDGGKSRIILNVLVTPAEVMENQPMLDLLWRTRFHWKLWPRQVTGDTKYGTEENIVAIEDQHIRAYVPLPDIDHRTEFFSADRFRYEAERDVYLCPAGKELHYFQSQSTDRQRRYRARAKDCNHCPLKVQCTTSKQGRSLCRSAHENYLDRVRAYHATEAYKKAYRKRSVWVEPLFAEAKDWHRMRRFRLRLLWRVNGEALVIAVGQNLKRLLKKRGWGRRPCPGEAVFALFLAVYGWLTRTSFRYVSLSSLIGSDYSLKQESLSLLILMSFAREFFNKLILFYEPPPCQLRFFPQIIGSIEHGLDTVIWTELCKILRLRSLCREKRNTLTHLPRPLLCPKGERKSRVFLRVDEYMKLLNAAGHSRDYAILQLFLQTGIRVAELAGLTLSGIDLDAQTMLINGKGNKQRSVYLVKKAIQALKAYLAD